MIVINAEPDGISIDGHAGYAKTGNDIICAAVSMLAQNLVNSISALTEDEIECHTWDGHMDIRYRDLSEKGKLLIDSFFVGIFTLHETYGDDYVKLSGTRMCGMSENSA